ncbi:hypothetical protein GCM10009677_62210 [Sphaerisporangium rubeum]|uniref:Ribbon-helix-helix protein, CopG family n=1 Tax=Sphaerisporangium rubeum TaxID=321317 RepID=A0A7X0IAJ8_9ACTN|nr:hypothetical protein [Sphaerisporangium rubeum]MBB6471520.1 hypothetical protein [Sphaerisporangium rubeum]
MGHSSFSIRLNDVQTEALMRQAHLEGRRVEDVIRSAVQRHIDGRQAAITLMSRWSLDREDLAAAAAALNVEPLTDEEWSQAVRPPVPRTRVS